METKVNLTLVGAFALALGLALIATTLWLASGGLWQKQFDIYLAVEEESVTGLNVNAPVRYNGVEVGKVRRITLDPQDPQRVNLFLDIEQGAPIRQDTVAVLKAQGLTGIAYVELSGGARNAPPLRALPGAPYPVIATKSSLSTRLENVLTRVLAKLDSTSNNVNAMLSEKNQLAFSAVLDNLARSTAQLGPVLQRVGPVLDRAGLTLERVGPAMERVGRGAESLARMGDAVTQTSLGASEAVAAIGADAKRLGTDTLPELERLLAEMQVLSASLRRLSEQTESAPSGLLFRHPPVRPGPGETLPASTAP
jgi:phospholipid/cholesterol/gamma-HCH transport system substrate-binding protein